MGPLSGEDITMLQELYEADKEVEELRKELVSLRHVIKTQQHSQLIWESLVNEAIRQSKLRYKQSARLKGNGSGAHY